MKKVMVIGQLPPPVHGLSLALKTFIESTKVKKKFKVDTINLTSNKKIIENSIAILKSDADLYYFTISQTKLGNLRDMLIIFLITLIKRRKVVIHYHGGYYKKLYHQFNLLQKKINKFLLNKVEKIIVLSENLSNLFEDVVSKDKIVICENCIQDQLLPSEREFNKHLKSNEKSTQLNVLYLSNFIKSKGYLEVLEAAKKMQNKQIKFYFAGKFFTEKEKLYFLNEIQKNKLNNIKYYDGVYGEEKRNLLLQSDIFILPTVYPKEGQPISILEAMGNMNVIISTKHAGIPDIVKKENGYLMDVNDSGISESIVRKLEYLLDNRDTVQHIKINNYNCSKERFSEQVYVDKLIRIIEDVN